MRIGRRAAALLAIASLVGALIAVAFAVVRGDAWRLPAVLVAVAAAIVGSWYLISRRGAASLAGGVVAGLGVLAMVLVTVTADYRGLPFAIAIILIAVSAVSARYGLQRDPGSLRRAQPPGMMVGAAKQPALIMNLKSGGGKAEKFRLADECARRGIEAIVLKPGDDLRQLASDAVARGVDVIGMAGGDGSQALVATVAAEAGVGYVCVPAGTRNHFALDLGLDREDVVGALDAFASGVERRVDLSRVNGRVFVNNACMGIYAKIVQSDEYRDAKLETAASMLPDILGPDAEPFDLQFEGPNGEEYSTAHLVLVSNDPYELDHLAGRGTRERLDLGRLGIVVARIASPRDAVSFVALESARKIRTFRGWLEWEAEQFRVDSGDPIQIGIDGEALVMDPPLVFESLPGALRVRIPQHSPGFAPAATSVRLTTTTVGELLRTAFGQ